MFGPPELAQLEPAEAVHVQVAPCSWSGAKSFTDAPSASDGPPLATVIVYVSVVPGIACVLPSPFVTDSFTSGVSRSSSVDESLPLVSVSPDAAGSLAALDSVPRAAGLIVPVSV